MTGHSRYRLEFLEEVRTEARELPEPVRMALAQLVVDLHSNPHLGVSMDSRWPENLEGSRKIRFDAADYDGKPRYRVVYRNEPTDGAVGVIVVLAVGRRDKMEAYAKASKRLLQQEAGRARPRRRL